MKRALLRLFLIAFSSVAAVAIALGSARWLGKTQSFAPLNHPMAQLPFLVIAETNTHFQFALNNSFIQSVEKTCPNCGIRVDARRSLDGKWYAFAKNETKGITNGTGYFSLKSSDEINTLHYLDKEHSPVLTLKDLVEKYPKTPLLVVLHSRDASQLPEVLEALQSREKTKNLIIHSPFRQILKDARKERPQWVFGVSPTGLAKILMMEALFIESMADIWSDFIISPVLLQKTKVFTHRFLDEMKRREKRIILEGSPHLDQLPKKLQNQIYGIVTKDYLNAYEHFSRRSFDTQ